MAKYINPIATGLAIGQGEAQVFDSSKIWKAKWDAEKEAKLEKEKKEKELLDSIIDIDTSNVWDRDLGMYNEKWGEYNEFIKNNYEALKNPSKNIDVYTQKKRMEQEMKQFVKSSANAQKMDAEVKKLRLENNKYYDKDGLLEAWQNEAGNFSNPYDMLGKHANPFANYVKTMKSTIATDIDEKTTKGGYYIEKKGTTDETWRQAWADQYDTDPLLQEDAQIWWEQAGGPDSGFDNPRDYMINKSMEFKDVVSEKKTRIPTSGSGSGSGNKNAEIDAMYGVDLSTERMQDVAGTPLNTKSYIDMGRFDEAQDLTTGAVMTIGGNPVEIQEGWQIERDQAGLFGVGTQWQIIDKDGNRKYEDLTKEDVESLVSPTTQEVVEGSYGEEATMALPSKFVNDRKVEYNAREFAPKGTKVLDIEGNPVEGADASGAVHAKPVAIRMNTKTGKMEIIAEFYPKWAANNPTNPRNVEDKQTVVYDYESNKEFLNTNYPRIKQNIQTKFGKWKAGTGSKYNK